MSTRRWPAEQAFRIRVSMSATGSVRFIRCPPVRFGDSVFTFVRAGEDARVLVGARRDFGHRFQTNNYGIAESLALSDHLPRLQDHVLGSAYANRMNFRDTYYDVVISATNKTPCSANTIGALLLDPAAYRLSIRRYVENLRGVTIPPEIAWMRELLDETISLFAAI